MREPIERLRVWRELVAHVPKVPGVYCVWAKDAPLYIGTSESLYERLRAHSLKYRFLESGADAVTFLSVTPEGQSEGVYRESVRRVIERRLIETHRPILNRNQLEFADGCAKWKERERELIDSVNRSRVKIRLVTPQSLSHLK